MSRTVSQAAELTKLRYQWVSTTLAAERIGGDPPVTTAHVVELIRAGELRARNVGVNPEKRPEYRVDPASIEEFLDRRTMGVNAERIPNPPPSGPPTLPDPAFVVNFR